MMVRRRFVLVLILRLKFTIDLYCSYLVEITFFCQTIILMGALWILHKNNQTEIPFVRRDIIFYLILRCDLILALVFFLGKPENFPGILSVYQCSPVPGRSSWLRAAAPSFHGWALVHCNTPACCPQQLPTRDETLWRELHCKEAPVRQNSNENDHQHSNCVSNAAMCKFYGLEMMQEL